MLENDYSPDFGGMPRYATVTKTDAMKRFGVSEMQLDELSFFSKTSGQKFKMKLYLQSQLEVRVCACVCVCVCLICVHAHTHV